VGTVRPIAQIVAFLEEKGQKPAYARSAGISGGFAPRLGTRMLVSPLHIDHHARLQPSLPKVAWRHTRPRAPLSDALAFRLTEKLSWSVRWQPEGRFVGGKSPAKGRGDRVAIRGRACPDRAPRPGARRVSAHSEARGDGEIAGQTP
jgi:hypothetical protein